jgi:hypothetical protein
MEVWRVRPGTRESAVFGRRRTTCLMLFAYLSLWGCANPGTYWKSRALDLWDVLPVAVNVVQEWEFGGLCVSARVTPLAQIGLGGYGMNSTEPDTFGMGLGRWGPAWKECGLHCILGSGEYQELDAEHWPGGPDERYQCQTQTGGLGRVNGNLPSR